MKTIILLIRLTAFLGLIIMGAGLIQQNTNAVLCGGFIYIGNVITSNHFESNE